VLKFNSDKGEASIISLIEGVGGINTISEKWTELLYYLMVVNEWVIFIILIEERDRLTKLDRT
jgi:hypothetical protein